MISDEETLKNEDEDNTQDQDYVMNTSKSSFNESFFETGHDDMPLRYRHIRDVREGKLSQNITY